MEVTAQVARNQHDWMFLTGFTRLTGLMKNEEGRMNLIRAPRFLNNDTSLETIILHELCQHHS